MTDVNGITVFGGTFPAEIWNSLYANGEIPCEEFSKPSKPISWTPFYGHFTSSAPGGNSVDRAASGREGTLPGQSAVGGYNPNAYAPGVGQKPTFVPPRPPPSSGSSPPPSKGGGEGEAGLEGGTEAGG